VLVCATRRPSTDSADTLVGDPGPSRRLSGNDIKNPGEELRSAGRAAADRHVRLHGQGPQGVPAITPEGRRARRRQRLRRRPLQTSQHFAIALDNALVSAPYINWRENPSGIDGSTGAQISGGFTLQTAQDLAKILKIGALPLKLNLVSRSQVSATLGKQALDQGLKAGIAGFIVVALFLIVFYRVLGVIATVALCIYALYFYAIVKLIPITMTLPGIAGLILTLGRRGRREHRRLRTRERGGTGREIGLHGDHDGLPARA
jgi:SecD/SecF fusion protein